MRYREFIISAAEKNIHAVQAGNYSPDEDVDLSKVLTEDEAIDGVTLYMLRNKKKPTIKKVTPTGYRIFD